MTRYAVKVRYVQERTIMVDAITPKQAAQMAEEVARGFTNVVAAQALEVREASLETLREGRRASKEDMGSTRARSADGLRVENWT